jgi:hypothetical protein
MTETEYPENDVACPCGKTFHLFWNGGELDRHDCSCGRKYYGEHRVTVMVTLEPGEPDPRQ